MQLEKFFDANTMSVHLREGVQAMAKKGKPGAWTFDAVSEKPLSAEMIETMAEEIIEAANSRADSFIDIDRPGSTIAQIGRYRVVILRPPLSDGWEITAVRPVRTLRLSEYKISEKLKKRIGEQAEGILIAGAPGMGKSTFSQALATYFVEQGKIVKTVEAPRDLVVPDTVTQLALSRGTPEEVHDILLLSRPDYSLFDEMRNPKDFELFADLRLAGVGMVGVVHGTCPMDAIQRFIGKLDLGVIPHVIDTVVFIKNGEISQVLAIKMEVKVPSGMTEADLARPVVVVSDFETNKAVAEIYSYGEETVIVPVTEQKARGAKRLAAEQIRRVLQKYADHIDVEVVSDNNAVVFVPEKGIPALIGAGGKNIQRLEEELGISLEVREHTGRASAPPLAGKEVPHQIDFRGKRIMFTVPVAYVGKDISLYIGDEYIATFNVGKKGDISVKKTSALGKAILDAYHCGTKLRFVS
ncbi:MAG: ATPase, T2SS/T4P/T4SS family [Candidatus Woesearchaeota archaeon]